ncbi:MAG: STAS domain-containing protein [Gemmatimonadetes bacterium]|nr:STAS domain-containing protein [Gemmatimonadota bacterium]
MASPDSSILPAVVRDHQREILQQWIAEQSSGSNARSDLLSDAELRQQSSEFLQLFREAVQAGNLGNVMGTEWQGVRELLATVSKANAIRGFTPIDTATFVLSLKRPLFQQLTTDAGSDADLLARETWTVTTVLDSLALFTTEVFQRSREEVISRQQQELMELSTPVVKLWDGILAVPLIGTLDSARTQVVMESLLQRIVDTEAGIAIIDIAGVPTVDTLVAQHLIKTVAAARLMGAECIISGIRPQIAQTIVHLGVELVGAVTKATLADAILYALRQSGWSVSRGRS